jgi:hypothetical protein
VNERQVGDQFAGVSVVEHVRALRQGRRPGVVVITDRYDDDALRRRMSEAGALP